MPVRAIKKIELSRDKLILKVPKAIIHSIHLDEGDVFVCEFKKHFDADKKLIREIKESMEAPCKHDYFGYSYGSNYLEDPHYITLTDTDLMKRYGFLIDEYLEIVFKEIKREKESIPMFPERMIEDLDFIPE